MNAHPKDFILTILPSMLLLGVLTYKANLNALQRYYNVSISARRRRKKTELITWSSVSKRISDLQFRRMFRMNRDCFHKLCEKIISCVGEKAFKSECYIDAFLRNKNSMFMAHEQCSGGYVCGKIKLAITLRILKVC